jgi:phage replication O-like protein O
MSKKNNNFTMIPNSVFDTILLKDKLGSREIRVLLCIIRLTFGFHKEKAIASTRYIAKWTGLDQSHVATTVKSLLKRKIILEEKTFHKGRKTRFLFINSDRYQNGIGDRYQNGIGDRYQNGIGDRYQNGIKSNKHIKEKSFKEKKNKDIFKSPSGTQEYVSKDNKLLKKENDTQTSQNKIYTLHSHAGAGGVTPVETENFIEKAHEFALEKTKNHPTPLKNKDYSHKIVKDILMHISENSPPFTDLHLAKFETLLEDYILHMHRHVDWRDFYNYVINYVKWMKQKQKLFY